MCEGSIQFACQPRNSIDRNRPDKNPEMVRGFELETSRLATRTKPREKARRKGVRKNS